MAFGFRGIRRHCGGCDGQADTPDPIPNSEVKRPGGENTLAGKIAAAAFFVAGIFSTAGKKDGPEPRLTAFYEKS